MHDDPTQPALPLDHDPDAPVPYRLTPRARRLVAPDTVPDLTVVEAPDDAPDDEVPDDLDDPHDPRSARARALRRGGLSVDRIARQLGVDELVVRTWVGDLGSARRRPRPALRAIASHRDDTADEDQLQRRREAFRHARAAAFDEAPARLSDPAFVRGLALTVGTAEVDAHALVVRVRDRDVGRLVARWLVEHAGARVEDLRVVLRIGTAASADLVVHAWADALRVPAERVSRTRWATAPSDDAVEAMLRAPGTATAARVAGWRDALLGEDGHQPTGPVPF